MPNLPSQTQLAKLPRTALVAYAVRCARRVQPLTELPDSVSDKIRLRCFAAVEAALNLATRWSRSQSVSNRSFGEAISATQGNLNIARGPNLLLQVPDEDIVSAFDLSSNAASDVVQAAANADHTNGAVEAAADYARDAAAKFKSKGRFVNSACEDYKKLLKRKIGNPEELGKPIDPSENGPLGPYWPGGSPDWYQSSRSKMRGILAQVKKQMLLDPELNSYLEINNDESESNNDQSDRLTILENQLTELQSKFSETDLEKKTHDATANINDLINETREGVQKLNKVIDDLSLKSEMVHREVRKTEEEVRSTTNQFSGLGKNYDSLRQSINEDFALLTNETKSKLLALEDTGVLKATTRDPAKFWAERKKYHQGGFKLWVWILVAVALVGGITISNILDSLTDEDGVLDPRRIGFTLLVGSIVLFSMRIVTRITMSHLHLRTEAEERIVMFESYLSLLSQEQLGDKEDRSLVLNALFRPSDNGADQGRHGFPLDAGFCNAHVTEFEVTKGMMPAVPTGNCSPRRVKRTGWQGQ